MSFPISTTAEADTILAEVFDPATTGARLQQLAAVPRYDIATGIILHANVMPDAIFMLCGHYLRDIRYLASRHCLCPTEGRVMAVLADEHNGQISPWERDFVLLDCPENLEFDSWIGYEPLRGLQETVPCCHPECPSRLEEHSSYFRVDDDVIVPWERILCPTHTANTVHDETTIDDYTYRRRLEVLKTVRADNVDDIRRLSFHFDQKVRGMVASRSNTPNDVLVRMSQSRTEYSQALLEIAIRVRRGAINRPNR